ncbi:MAG: hypothetical protein KAX49_19445 [Halanaerobiales bacterium]|nr:hypothetical protein [Halanaerobiales bacterium]
MIQFNKDSKISITMKFDHYGANSLMNSLSAALNDKALLIQIDEHKTSKQLKFLKNEIDSSIFFARDEVIVIELDTDELEYAIERLNNCIKEKEFYPVEFFELRYKDRVLTVYVIYELN